MKNGCKTGEHMADVHDQQLILLERIAVLEQQLAKSHKENEGVDGLDSRPQDRPDLIESELSGLAFDSNQQIFRPAHIQIMFEQKPPDPVLNEAVYLFIDPAAGGPQSDYAILSVTRQKGLLTVSLPPPAPLSCTDRPRAGSPQRPHGSRGSP